MGTLSGVRVLDLSRFVAGPLCGQLLAEQGAEVIRVEPPEGGEDRYYALIGPDGENLPFKIFARNKKGISLSLSTERGRTVFEDLVKVSDVVLHNLIPGTSLSAQLSYSHLKKINPRIVVGLVSGYGAHGPRSRQVGLDFAMQGGVGSMVLNGFPEGPPMKASVPYIDCCTGTACALGIALALYHRERTGVGQLVDVSLFDMGYFITQSLGTLMLYKLKNERRERLANFGFSTYMSCLQAKDGQVMVVPSTDSMWARFAAAIGREDMITDPRFSATERWRHTAIIDEVVQKWANQRTTDEIIDTFRKARIACERVNSADELMDDPHVAARNMIVWNDYPGLGNIPFPGIPLKMSETPGEIKTLAPKVGEHNREIYEELIGLTSEQIDRMRKEGII